MIEIRELTKRYGRTVAVDDLSFTVRPGHVTGFLGPNGAGKTTTMRVLLGLDAAGAGSALVGGRRYATIRRPMFEVGALLDAAAVHPGRRAADHLTCLAYTNGIGRRRVAEVLESVGLAGVARRRVGRFSLGMRQRLGIAGALLGDPGVLILDEPVNGLDPEGVRWIRDLTRSLAAEGRTILLSSHLMSEMELTADRLVVIGRGRLIAETSVAELAARFARGVIVHTPRAGELSAILESAGATVGGEADGGLNVTGLDAAGIGDLAARHGVPVHAIAQHTAPLEDAYMRLTADAEQFRAAPRGVAR